MADCQWTETAVAFFSGLFSGQIDVLVERSRSLPGSTGLFAFRGIFKLKLQQFLMYLHRCELA